MYTGGVFPASTKKRKLHQNSAFERPKSSGQPLNYATSTNPHKFIQNYRNNLADIYFQKYGNLCNHIPSPIPRINLHLDKPHSADPALFYKKSAHVNKRSGSFNKNDNLPLEPQPKVVNVFKIMPQKTSVMMWDSNYYVPPNFGTSKKIAPNTSTNVPVQNAIIKAAKEITFNGVKKEIEKMIKIQEKQEKKKIVKQVKKQIEQTIKNEENAKIKPENNAFKQQNKNNIKIQSNPPKPVNKIPENNTKINCNKPKPVNKMLENSTKVESNQAKPVNKVPEISTKVEIKPKPVNKIPEICTKVENNQPKPVNKISENGTKVENNQPKLINKISGNGTKVESEPKPVNKIPENGTKVENNQLKPMNTVPENNTKVESNQPLSVNKIPEICTKVEINQPKPLNKIPEHPEGNPVIAPINQKYNTKIDSIQPKPVNRIPENNNKIDNNNPKPVNKIPENSTKIESNQPKPVNKIPENPKGNSVTAPNNQKAPQQKAQGSEVNKNVKSASPTKQNNTPPPEKKSNQITEIYKRPEENKSATSLQNPFPVPKIESASFQKVTEDLTQIIKNLQKQIQEVSVNKPAMEEVPSALIQPKEQSFFKKPTPTTNNQKPAPNTNNQKPAPTANNQQTTPAPNNQKTAPNNNNRNNSTGQKSNFSSSSTIPQPSVTSAVSRKYSSSTNQSYLTPRGSSTSSRRSSRMSLGSDPLKVLKEEVQRAIRDRKTFTVFGRYPTIRRALRERGWVEKFHGTYKNQLNEELRRYPNYTISELLPLIKNENLSELCKNLIRSKLLASYQVDFYWAFREEGFRENPDKYKLTMINKLKRDIFSYTNKQGLCDSNKHSYWYQKPKVSKLNHPRTYSLAAKNGDIKEFIDDFNLTAAMSLLKWIVKTNITKESKLVSPSGKVPLEVFDFALNECCKFIKKCKHEDIDTRIQEASNHEWEQFLDYFYKIVHYSNHFAQGNKKVDESSMIAKSNYVLNTLLEIYPYLEMDGMLNIWILKPSASCMGRGIHLCRTLQYALKVLKDNPNTRYIIQKYIERPLLIYNTKFDIRQWFLISNCSPLTIWMYKECYLRFSSQTYNLRKLHESIHLTNNSVQSKYKNTTVDAVLPYYNMWDSNEFKKYLTNIGYPTAFQDIIYPGMKQCITAAILMHQDKMIIRKNCFELYGADFILTEDFKPWMLEINSNPALNPSTPVTARMCPRVQEDVIKVVIDYPRNVRASTGHFEMIYKEQLTKLPEVKSLEVRGHPLKDDYFYHTPEEESRSCVKSSYNTILIDQKQKSLKIFGEEIKKTLKNLLDIIHNEKTKRIASA